MTHKRLREPYRPRELRNLYQKQYDHSVWPEHRSRVLTTVAVGMSMVPATGPTWEGADLSCGDAAIAHNFSFHRLYLGDITPGWEYTGSIEQTIEKIPSVDMFICTETLEHVDDPPEVLGQISGKARRLLLSTPIEAWDDPNPEHYWAWDRRQVESMISGVGYEVYTYCELDFRSGRPNSYCFGIWGCVKP